MPRIPDLGNTLVVLGLGALAFSSLLPMLNGQRVARVENRALEVAEAMRELCPEPAEFDGMDDAAWDQFAVRLRAHCTAAGQPESDLPARLAGVGPPPTFGNRHYLFRILERPRSKTEIAPSQPEPTRLDVYAWPRTLQPPGRSVFCLTAEGTRNYTRNLVASYADVDTAPPPGAAEPRTDTEDPTRSLDSSYRSVDGERWIRF